MFLSNLEVGMAAVFAGDQVRVVVSVGDGWEGVTSILDPHNVNPNYSAFEDQPTNLCHARCHIVVNFCHITIMTFVTCPPNFPIHNRSRSFF